MGENRKKLPACLSIAGCMLLYTAIVGIGANCRGIFFTPIARELNISLSRLTAFYVFYGVASALATPLCCRLFRRFSISPVLTATVTIYGATVFLMGYASRVEVFYLLAAIQGTVGGFLVYYPAQTIISQWFPERKGTILGIVLTSSGICGAVMNPMLSQWIELYGWRASFRIAGEMILGMGLLATIVCLHWDPPREAEPASKAKEKNPKRIPREFLREVLLLYVFSLCIALTLGFSQHLPSLALDYGKTAAFGAKLVSASMIGNLVAKLVLGRMNDRFGAAVSALTGIACAIAGCSLLFCSSQDVLLMVGASSVGVIMALNAMHVPMLPRVLLSEDLYNRVYPTICSMVSLVGSTSSMILAVIYDLTGGYRAVTVYVTLVSAVCAASAVLLMGMQKKQKAEA